MLILLVVYVLVGLKEYGEELRNEDREKHNQLRHNWTDLVTRVYKPVRNKTNKDTSTENLLYL